VILERGARDLRAVLEVLGADEADDRVDQERPVATGEAVAAGLDRAVIPTVVTGAADLGQALQGLVDCNQLGQLVADELAIPTPGAFATACRVGLEAAAAKLDERLAAIDAAPLELHVTGSALGYDRDGDGAMDVVDDGTWTGTMTYDGASAPLGAGAFRGSRQ
jgi:hypothetical protein